jgi:hypothetical protein
MLSRSRKNRMVATTKALIEEDMDEEKEEEEDKVAVEE